MLYSTRLLSRKTLRVEWSKRCDKHNKDAENSPNVNRANNDNSSFQKLRQKPFYRYKKYICLCVLVKIYYPNEYFHK